MYATGRNAVGNAAARVVRDITTRESGVIVCARWCCTVNQFANAASPQPRWITSIVTHATTHWKIYGPGVAHVTVERLLCRTVGLDGQGNEFDWFAGGRGASNR